MIRLPLACLLVILPLAAQDESEFDLAAANPDYTPLNQLRVSGNACGPAALLSAYGFGSERWRELAEAVPGDNDRRRISHVIRGYGLRKSAHLDRPRWTRSDGMSLSDLTDVANEMRGGRWLPSLRNEILILKRRESHRKLLARTHDRMARSLRKGLPPIASLQRLVLRPNGKEGARSWQVVQGHFVVVIGLPGRLGPGAEDLPFRYADPWGGRILRGSLAVRKKHGYPALVAEVPSSNIGKDGLRRGEESIVTLAAVLGVF